MHERRYVPEYVPGPTCLANTMCRLTGIYIPNWRLVRERDVSHRKAYAAWDLVMTL